jgi:hypothetical protein
MRYIVEFTIADEKVSKFFNKRDQAKKFAGMVDGKIITFTDLDDLRKDKK